MSVDLELLMTDACSLCEQAMDLLLSMPEVAGHRLVTRDIVGDDALFEEFAEKIPVLRIGGEVSCWPFGAREVASMIDQASGS